MATSLTLAPFGATPIGLRALPVPTRPVLDETLDGYVWRLARANRLNPHKLASSLRTSTRRWTPRLVEHLTLLSGQDATALRYAILELNTEDELSAMRVAARAKPGVLRAVACSFCCHRRGITDTVERWRRTEDVVCHHHQRWIGTRRQLDLRSQPDILTANRRHRRLITRHGRAAVLRAFHEAESICREWADDRTHDRDFTHRMARFLGPTWEVDVHHPAIAAALYPQTVALTRLLADPSWRSLPLLGGRHLDTFVAEVRRTTAPRYQWNPYSRYRRHEPLARLFINEQELQHNRDSWPPPPPRLDAIDNSTNDDLRQKD